LGLHKKRNLLAIKPGGFDFNPWRAPLSHLLNVDIQSIDLDELGIVIRKCLGWEGSREWWYRDEERSTKHNG